MYSVNGPYTLPVLVLVLSTEILSNLMSRTCTVTTGITQVQISIVDTGMEYTDTVPVQV